MYNQSPEIPSYDNKQSEKIKCPLIEAIYHMENSVMMYDIYRQVSNIRRT